MPGLTLVTGGARSGKSSYALSRVTRQHRHPAFVATAQAFDDEMRDRIARHKTERGDRFRTIEAPLNLAAALTSLPEEVDIAVVDCLTVWLGNLYHHSGDHESRIRAAVDALIDALPRVRCDLVIVTNEVGWGIVPENSSARSFRDMAGMLNRRVAKLAEEVHLCVCGLPVCVKQRKGESSL
jgi:adenosylcobinamide kinase/adenosylcobinamide-phosphate guanylyltransferase